MLLLTEFLLWETGLKHKNHNLRKALAVLRRYFPFSIGLVWGVCYSDLTVLCMDRDSTFVDWNRLPWPGSIVTICMSCFMTGDPDKEYGTNKSPPTGRVRERSKRDTTRPSTSQNPSHSHPSWLSDACATRKDSELEWLAKDHPETNPITIKPKTSSHVGEQFSPGSLTYCSPPGCPFPIKSLALSAHVSPRTIHFWVLDKSPVSGPGRGPPSCNTLTKWMNYFLKLIL